MIYGISAARLMTGYDLAIYHLEQSYLGSIGSLQQILFQFIGSFAARGRRQASLLGRLSAQ